jgi:hypothetical protein
MGTETIAPASGFRKRAGLFGAYVQSGRYFYPFAAGINLLLLLIGFSPYYLHHRGEDGRTIHPVMVVFDFVHGLSIAAWYVLVLVQALLVASDHRRLHMRLGWLSVALVPLITISAVVTALHSVREMPRVVRFEMPYPHFLLVMLTEVAVFVVCAIAGILLRKQPAVHRVLMMTASLSLLGGATSRIPWLDDIFGGYTQTGFFGPIFAWGAVLTILGSLRLGTLDRRLAAGVGLVVISELAAASWSLTDSWAHWAAVMVR